MKSYLSISNSWRKLSNDFSDFINNLIATISGFSFIFPKKLTHEVQSNKDFQNLFEYS